MAPRILVDLLGFTGARGGTETYVRELVTRLPALMPGVRFTALVGRVGAEQVAAFFPGEVRTVRCVGASPASWAAGELLIAEPAARRLRADLLWTPANFGPIGRSRRRVTTIHDVIYHEVPGDPAERATRAVTSWLMSRSARTADAVIAVSESTAAAIRARIGVPGERIRVVLNGSSDPRPVRNAGETLSDLRLPPGRTVVLSTGNRMPHKNFEGLLRALAAIDAPRRPLAVLPGGHGEDRLAPEVARLGLGDDVVLPGWVSPEQLEALYAVAAVYVCPSLAEGFGLPVVDAMRRGCAVLANDIPVLREVGGAAAVYADATSPAEFGAALAAVAATAADPVRREAGVTWASGFTWDAAAQATAAVLDEALSRPAPARGGRPAR